MTNFDEGKYAFQKQRAGKNQKITDLDKKGDGISAKVTESRAKDAAKLSSKNLKRKNSEKNDGGSGGGCKC